MALNTFKASYWGAKYFRPVWFVDDESTMLPEEIKPVVFVEGSCGGGYEDSKKRKRRLQQEEREEEEEMAEIMLVIQSFLHVQSATRRV
jgi:hypothetical protein